MPNTRDKLLKFPNLVSDINIWKAQILAVLRDSVQGENEISTFPPHKWINAAELEIISGTKVVHKYYEVGWSQFSFTRKSTCLFDGRRANLKTAKGRPKIKV